LAAYLPIVSRPWGGATRGETGQNFKALRNFSTRLSLTWRGDYLESRHRYWRGQRCWSKAVAKVGKGEGLEYFPLVSPERVMGCMEVGFVSLKFSRTALTSAMTYGSRPSVAAIPKLRLNETLTAS